MRRDTPMYPPEMLDPEADDGTMVASLDALSEAVVGHRIVSAKTVQDGSRNAGGLYGEDRGVELTLDSGRTVRLVPTSDCCAYTYAESVLLNPEKVDHVITGVGTTDGFETWHIYADLGDVLELNVAWSCGNPFFYGYGFSVQVQDPPEDPP